MMASARNTFRQHVREETLAVAYDLTVEHGWERVRLNELATLVGVSRPTLYKEFGDKQGLGEALVLREADLFLAGISEVIEAHSGDAAAAVTAAVTFTLDEAAASPLLRAVLTSPRAQVDEPTSRAAPGTGMLPMLTTSATLLAVASERLVAWIRAGYPELDPQDVADAIDATVRLTVSHLVLPAADSLETGRRISGVAARYLGLPRLPRS